MLSSWSSTIITVFGISHLLESSVGEPRRGGLRARLRTARSESLVPIRYRNANNDLRPRAPQGELPLPSSAIGIYIASARNLRRQPMSVGAEACQNGLEFRWLWVRAAMSGMYRSLQPVPTSTQS